MWNNLNCIVHSIMWFHFHRHFKKFEAVGFVKNPPDSLKTYILTETTLFNLLFKESQEVVFGNYTS